MKPKHKWNDFKPPWLAQQIALGWNYVAFVAKRLILEFISLIWISLTHRRNENIEIVFMGSYELRSLGNFQIGVELMMYSIRKIH